MNIYGGLAGATTKTLISTEECDPFNGSLQISQKAIFEFRVMTNKDRGHVEAIFAVFGSLVL